jgi:hypothetical protein
MNNQRIFVDFETLDGQRFTCFGDDLSHCITVAKNLFPSAYLTIRTMKVYY